MEGGAAHCHVAVPEHQRFREGCGGCLDSKMQQLEVEEIRQRAAERRQAASARLPVGPAARRTHKELKVLRLTLGVPVETYDERLSTVEADGSLRAAEVPASRRSQVIDSAAASVILQGWLDARRGGAAGVANREPQNRESGK